MPPFFCRILYDFSGLIGILSYIFYCLLSFPFNLIIFGNNLDHFFNFSPLAGLFLKDFWVQLGEIYVSY